MSRKPEDANRGPEGAPGSRSRALEAELRDAPAEAARMAVGLARTTAFARRMHEHEPPEEGADGQE